MTDVQQHPIDAARAAAEQDELEEWVCRFLASPGSDNAPLAAKLSDPPRAWLGPVRLPLSDLCRLAGPPGEPVLVEVDEDEWRADVDEMERQVERGRELAPVIVSHRDGTLVLEDGNHRVEALRRAGAGWAWAVVAFDEPEERDAFDPPPVPDDA